MIHNLSFSLRFLMALIPCWLKVMVGRWKQYNLEEEMRFQPRFNQHYTMPCCRYFPFHETTYIPEQVHQLGNQFLTDEGIIMFRQYVLCLEHEHLRTATLDFSWYFFSHKSYLKHEVKCQCFLFCLSVLKMLIYPLYK